MFHTAHSSQLCAEDDEVALASMVRVLTVGPNAGLQKVLTFPTLEVGGVNRASHVTSYCGGKGQGAALALNIWEPGSAAVASFLGGDSGVFCEEVLTSAGLDTITEKVASTTRTCTTLLCLSLIHI